MAGVSPIMKKFFRNRLFYIYLLLAIMIGTSIAIAAAHNSLLTAFVHRTLAANGISESITIQNPPINGTDATEKSYVDAAVGGKSPRKKIFFYTGSPQSWSPLVSADTWVAVTIIGGGGAAGGGGSGGADPVTLHFTQVLFQQ